MYDIHAIYRPPVIDFPMLHVFLTLSTSREEEYKETPEEYKETPEEYKETPRNRKKHQALNNCANTPSL